MTQKLVTGKGKGVVALRGKSGENCIGQSEWEREDNVRRQRRQVEAEGKGIGNGG